MKLQEIYDSNNSESLNISFEFFPPKNPSDIKTDFYQELSKLLAYKPKLISITSSACGNKDLNSVETLEFVKKNTNVTIMPHLTCTCTSKANISEKLSYFETLGFENILALRGDRPQNAEDCFGDFKYASELIEYIRANNNFSIAAAGYPEGHIEASDLKTDIENLKRKIDLGAQVIFTQLFFDNSKFYRYLGLLEQNGISVPVVAGIMPVFSYKQVVKMTSLAKISVPADFYENLEKFGNSPSDIKNFGVDFAVKQCKNLIENGVGNLHFYTINRSELTTRILDSIINKT